ncbi:MAG: M15 family metallopeptidase, partial [Bacilli bacterium]
TIIPLIIIILGIVDLVKAVLASKDDGLTSAFKSLIMRLILGFSIFFIPTIISMAFSLVKDSATFINASDACQVCLLRPTSDECVTYKTNAATEREERNKILRTPVPNDYSESEEIAESNNNSGSGNNNSNTISGNYGAVVSVKLNDLSCDVTYDGQALKSLQMNENIKNSLSKGLESTCKFLSNNKSIYNSSNVVTAGTYNPGATIKYPHFYAMGIDLFNSWSITYNGKKYTPYANYGPSSWTTYNNFICEVCNGKEECDKNLNYQLYKNIFKDLGYCWGGNWGTKYHDPMHFELSKYADGSCSTKNKPSISC